MQQRLRSGLTCLLAALHVFSATAARAAEPSAVQAPADRQTADRQTYERCRAADEEGLRKAITAISAEALRTSTRTVDYKALVDEQWRRVNLDKIIDSRVDMAIDEVKATTSWTERLKSLTNTEVSQKLATEVADRVYHAETVRVAIEDLATGVATDVARTFEFASADTSNALLECLRTFIGPRYGTVIAEGVAGDSSRSIALQAETGSGDVTKGAILKETSGGIAGITLLVVRRQLATLATRIGQRIVGSVLSRLVSVVAGGVGLILIAKDIWDFRHGVLPIIASEMKSEATKSKVREEIALSIGQQMNRHVDEIAAATGDHVVEVWQAFKNAHAVVLRIAERDGTFRAYLDSLQATALPRLDEVVGLLVQAESENAVLDRLQNGTLNSAVTMPDEAMTIARETKSVAHALDWTTLAGPDLPKVVEYELYRRAKPSDFSHASLRNVLSLGDRTAVVRLASIPTSARDTLFTLQPDKLASLVGALSETELAALAGYLQGLQPDPRKTLLDAVAASPGRMQVLSSQGVRDAILASRDQAAAAALMLRPSAGLDAREVLADAKLVWDGRVNPMLIRYRHPAATAIAGLLAIILALWLTRLFRARPAETAPPAGT